MLTFCYNSAYAAIPCQNGVCNKQEAKDIISGLGHVYASDKYIDASKIDPEQAISFSDSIMFNGLPDFLIRINTNKNIAGTAKYMSSIYKQGKLHLPSPKDKGRHNLKQNVLEIYNQVLVNFGWKDDHQFGPHTTEVTPEEVATFHIFRARIKAIKQEWEKFQP